MNDSLRKRLTTISLAMCPLNTEQRSSHIAYLIKRGKIVHIGINKWRTHPKNQSLPYHDGMVGVHAELDAVLKSGKEDLSDYTLAVLRVDRNNRLTNSKPCKGCRHLIQQVNIKKVFHSDIDGNIVQLDLGSI